MIDDTYNYDVAIIGAGVVESAIARELSKYQLKIALIEKSSDVSEGISKANSGVIHAGFNVPPGSLKAKFNRTGLDMLPKIANELGVPYRICKKLVIAKNDQEKNELQRLYDQGQKNTTPGLSIVNEKAIKQLQPGVEGKWALLSERTGIILPFQLTVALAENAAVNGVKVFLNSKVTAVRKNHNDLYSLQINGVENLTAQWVINAAGFGAGKISAMLPGHLEVPVYPCRGEYLVLDRNSGDILDMAVYPVPHKDNRGLGIHITPTMEQNVIIGPSAEYIADCDTSTTYQVIDQLKKESCEMLPELKKYSTIRTFSGIRPKLFIPSSGVTFADFIVEESQVHKKFINLIGIESPGLTSSPAIAKHIAEDIIAAKMELNLKYDFIPQWDTAVRFHNLNINEKKKIIAKNPDYGNLICRCENVTKAELIKALSNPLGVKTLDGIKKRIHALAGRCQSGFCMARIVDILVREYDIPPEEITLKGRGSSIITSKRT